VICTCYVGVISKFITLITALNNQNMRNIYFLHRLCTLTSQVTLPEEQSASWETASRSGGQEKSRLLWNSTVHCCFHMSPHVSQMNLIHIPLPHFFNIHFNIIFSREPRSFPWSRSFGFSTRNFVHNFHIPYLCYICFSPHSS
jgi:hypothetical protein